MTVARPIPTASHTRGDLRTTGLIGLAHFTSHFLMVAIAPLLPLMKAEFNVSFTQLGFILSVFFATSGIGQVAAGMIVDRIGPHRLLLGGVALQSVSVLLMGFAPSWLLLLPLAFFAGLGNTVYHPSDLSILSRRITLARQGRAFASHSMAGALGFAVSPLAMGFIGLHWGWRVALIAGGIFGLLSAASLLLNRTWLHADDFHPHATSESDRTAAPARRLSFFELLRLPVVMFGFAFFLLTAFAGAALMNFTVSALTEGYGVVLTTATIAIALLQFGSIGGTLVGGMAADRYGRHYLIASIGVFGAGVALLPIVYTGLPLALIMVCLTVSGIFGGLGLPSRDLLIRGAAPRGNLGKTFGSVYSGLDAGSLIGPLLIGPLLDHNMPQFLFLSAAIAFFLSIFTVIGIRGPSDQPK